MRTWHSILDRPRRVFAGVVAAVSTVLLLAWTVSDAVPGETAILTALYAGHDPFTPLSHWLWRVIGSLFDTLPVGSIGFRWNLLSALFGAGTTTLVFLLTARLVGTPLDREVIPPPQRRAAGNLAGLVSVALLLFCLPYRLASTTAHPILLELLLVLLAFWFLVRHRESGSFHSAAIAVLLYGIAATQHPPVLAAGVVFLILLVAGLWKHGHLAPASVAMLAGCGVLSIGPFFMEAALYLQTPSFRWSGMTGFGHLLSTMAGTYYSDLRHALPPVGITIVILYGIAPFFMATLMPKRKRPGVYLLVIAGLAVTLPMFFLFRFTPWPMFGFKPLLITPYILAAMAAGVLVTHLVCMLPQSWFVLRRRNRNPWLEPALVNGCLAATTGVILAAGIVSHRTAGAEDATAAARFAGAVIGQLEDGDWLVAEDNLEPLLRLKAAEQRKDLQILSAARFGFTSYEQALCETLADDRLCAMARVGLIPLLAEAQRLPGDQRPRVAVVGNRALLRFVTDDIQPDGLVYRIGMPPPADPDAHLARQRDQWQQVGAMLRGAVAVDSAFFPAIQQILLAISRTANDAGVWLEQHDRPDLARHAYEAAIELAANNLSARLNLLNVLEDDPVRVGVLKEEIETISASLRGRSDLAAIMETYGLIHHQDSSRVRAMRWYRAGNTDMALEELEAGISAARIDEALARPDDDEAYRDLLDLITVDDDAYPMPAVIALARLAAIKERPALARRFIDLLPADAPPEQLAIERANIEHLAGNRNAAYAKLSTFDPATMRDPRGWMLLALLSVDINPAETARYIERLEAYPDLPPQVRLALVKLHIARGNVESASRHLGHLMQSRRLDREVLTLYLEMLLQRQRLDVAMPTIRQLLQIDTRDPLANYALGALFIMQGLYDEARSALETSIAIHATPEALNDYAYVLYMQGDYTNALPQVESSLAARPSPSAWHTKVLILEADNRIPEAREALRNGLALDGDHPDLNRLRLELDPAWEPENAPTP